MQENHAGNWTRSQSASLEEKKEKINRCAGLKKIRKNADAISSTTVHQKSEPVWRTTWKDIKTREGETSSAS